MNISENLSKWSHHHNKDGCHSVRTTTHHRWSVIHVRCVLVCRTLSQNRQPMNRWLSLPLLVLSHGASGTQDVALNIWSCRYSDSHRHLVFYFFNWERINVKNGVRVLSWRGRTVSCISCARAFLQQIPVWMYTVTFHHKYCTGILRYLYCTSVFFNLFWGSRGNNTKQICSKMMLFSLIQHIYNDNLGQNSTCSCV